MSMQTQWGYLILDADSLTDMLTPSEFEAFTSGKYTESARVEAEISSACSAVRDYVGWHLYPAHACRMNATFFSENVKSVKGDILIQLPARFVSSIESITIAGTEYADYILETNGLLRVFGANLWGISKRSAIVIEYTAGLTSDMMAAVKELLAYRVTHSMAVPAGITSQATGGVSVTYNANWVNSARATALPDDNKEVLAPYRLQGVF